MLTRRGPLLTRSLLIVTLLTCLLTPPAAAQQTRPDSSTITRSSDSSSGGHGRRSHGVPYSEYAARVQGTIPVSGQAAGWTNVVQEGFEGTWPTTGWESVDEDNPGTPGFPVVQCWGAVSFQGYRSTRSAWPAGGCANALNPATSDYANNMNSWMVYGPFSLQGATAAYATIKLWAQIAGATDSVGVYASVDNVDFYGVNVRGNTTATSPPTTDGWSDLTLDLAQVPPLGSLLGRPSVWVAVIFDSDATLVDNGPFVDNFVIARRNAAQSTIGGRNLVLRPAPGAVNLTWNTGTAETGYLIDRWSPVQGHRIFPQNAVPLPAGTTTFTDTSTLTDDSYCYLVIPMSGNNVIGFSDFFCTYSAPPTGNAAGNFSITLGQSDIATLTWNEASGATGYRLEVTTFDGGPTTTVALAPGSSPYRANTRAQSTCYQLTTLTSGQVAGRTQRICAVPGIVTLKATAGLGAALEQAVSQISSGSSARTR